MKISEAKELVKGLHQGKLYAYVRLHKYKPKDSSKAKVVFIGGSKEVTMSVAFAFPARILFHWNKYLEDNNPRR